ncbi:MAG: hypothetical protein EPN21_18120 [Methylococcaceae bacterium]|nr:MAG: hypothetical protein EPN21_18120 [Methylococcaceae bacterium]
MSTINGAVITDFGGYDTGKTVLVQGDGKIVVMGIRSGATGDDFAMARYNSNGSLDTTFSGDGKLTATAVMTIGSVTLLSDGKFLAAGTSGDDFMLARYNSNGALDTDFSSDGKSTADLYAGNGRSLTVQVDGKVVVAGASYNNVYFAVARFNSDGSLDTSFDSDGINPYAFSGGANSVALQPDGKVVLGGWYGSDFAVVRYNRDGSVDNSFAGDGGTSTDMGGTDVVSSVNVLSSGKVLAAGTSNGDFAVARYNIDGSLDTSFDGDGKLITDLGGTETLSSILMLSNGKFIAAGTDANHDMVLIRYNSDGSLDTSFSGDGKVTTDLGGWEWGNSVALQADGKILLAGASDTDFALARYNSNGSLDSTFNGTATAANHEPTGTVTISGNPVVGQTLRASDTLADADGLGAISYQWKAGSVAVGTGASYTLTSASVGKKITVIASYVDDGGTAESKASAATAAVTAQSANTGNPGFSVNSGGDLVTGEDGATVVFSVSLTAQPNRDVSVTFAASDATEATLTNAKLTFTSSNWSTPQTLTVAGKDDAAVDGDVAYQITATVNTIDVNYSDVSVAPLTLTNQDDDIAGATIYGDEGGSQNDVLVGTTGDDKLFGLNKKDDLSGGLGDDELWGGYDNDILFGNEGNDKLYGEQNDDYMEGGEGDDTLDGGLGKDTMIGGAGNDTYVLGYDVTDIINDQGLAGDVDTVIMPYQVSRYTLPVGIENGAITEGNAAANLTGNTSNNVLTGNDGNNGLNGAVGRDTLFGGVGTDKLTGGDGADVFDFNSIAESGISNARDMITDFSAVQGDKIDLSGMDANTASSGNQSFTMISGSVFSAAGQLRYDAGLHVLYGNVDADVAPEFSIQLSGVAGTNAASFVL